MFDFITPLPFHESIVLAIKTASWEGLYSLSCIIKTTKIPKNHDAIISAWHIRTEQVHWIPEDTIEVEAYLIEQKKLSEQPSVSSPSFTQLEDLTQETERLLSLLKDRQIGLFTWHTFLYESLKRMRTLISTAIEK